jgi:Cdc6-like AAA superfamily ATPase
MQTALNISIEDVIRILGMMTLDEMEKVKDAIIRREVYFKKYKKDKIENVIQDFQAEGYSQGFLEDLEAGLRKSSIYNEN